MNTRSVIIGAGEVGQALYTVLVDYYNIRLFDKGTDTLRDANFLHIAFPYSPDFIGYVLEYKEEYKPKYTVIHSTVPVGTSTKCGATHSPVRGNHYDLVRSLKTMTKFVGGKDADAVAQYFLRAGIPVMICRKSETTELGKLLCTAFYGVCIEYIKAAEKQCEKEAVPFSEAFTLFQKTYNEGYTKLGRPEVSRPVLAPIQDEIGGHCVLPNCDLLDFKFTKLIKEMNDGR